MSTSGLAKKIKERRNISRRLEEEELEEIKEVHKILIEHVGELLKSARDQNLMNVSANMETLYVDLKALQKILPESFTPKLQELEKSLRHFLKTYLEIPDSTRKERNILDEKPGKINVAARLNMFIGAFIPSFKHTVFKGLANEADLLRDTLERLSTDQAYEIGPT